MAESQKVVVNLATGLDDAERVTVAFLVAGAALEKGKQVRGSPSSLATRLPRRSNAASSRAFVSAGSRALSDASTSPGSLAAP
jgi:hypothetical protein